VQRNGAEGAGRRKKAKVECSEMAQKALAEGRRQKAKVYFLVVSVKFLVCGWILNAF
jgi:hypothetical protein